jgi:phosphate transport system substrate-binding protein
LEVWAEGFSKFNPGAKIVATLHGPESTMAGVYNGVADLAFMEREMKLPLEHMAFAWVYLYPEFSVDIANAGLGADRPGANIAVFVNRNSSLTQLSLAQLDGLLGAEHRRGAGNIRVWGDLGADGSEKDRAIHVYGPAVDSAAGIYLRQAVMKDSFKWNPDYREYPDGRAALDALAHDPDGIGLAPLAPAKDSVKPIALGKEPGGPFVELTAQSVINHDYPLGRRITMVLNRPPGRPIDPKVKEFLRYVLSREGQAAIAQDGAYLPLSAADIRRQRDRLE